MTQPILSALSAPLRVDYRVTGLDCAEEVRALRAALEPLEGVEELGFDLLRSRLSVRFDPARTDEPRLRAAVAGTGLRAEPWGAEGIGRVRDQGRWDRRALLVVLSGSGLVFGFLLHAWAGGLQAAFTRGVPAFAVATYLVAVAAGLLPVLPKAAFAARRLRPDMNLLMAAAVAGAMVLGEWLEAASVSFLFSLSLLLEGWSVGRARRAVAALLDLAPAEASVLHDGEHAAGSHEHRVPASSVAVGSRVLVKPGERVPLDGRVLAGRSALDQAAITGESLPVEKGPGDLVFAGTINGGGALEIETTRPLGQTTLARIVALVEAAQARRSPSEQFVERFARIYTPVVLGLALCAWLLPPLVSAASWSSSLYDALVLLVIACPCALVISTPVSIVSALTAAARAGVLVKDGRSLEAPAHLRCLALDKTGTLTVGRPEVHRVLPLDEHTEEDLLRVAAAIEARSSHPLAMAIIAAARARGLLLPAAADVASLPGQGVSGTVEGQAFWIGSHRYLEQRGQEQPEVHDTLERLEADGHTVVVLGTDDHVCGMLTVLDRPRPEAAAAVAALHAAGVERLVLLTGDNAGTAAVLAAAVGLDEVRPELLPEDKLAAIEALIAEHGAVGMVGDGVNDAPALARSTLGVALGGAGTDAAIETADVVVMSDDLMRLPWLVHHARATLSVVRQNIVASLAIKALFVVLALGGWASLWAAIAADMGVSLLVVANALRLLGRSASAAPGLAARAGA